MFMILLGINIRFIFPGHWSRVYNIEGRFQATGNVPGCTHAAWESISKEHDVSCKTFLLSVFNKSWLEEQFLQHGKWH